MKFLKKLVITIFIILLLVFLYSKFLGIKGLVVKEYKISANIDKNYDSIKIVHLSDIHYNRSIKSEQLKAIVDKINYIKPDIVVITGDIFSDKKPDDDLIKYLKSINATIGKYAIKGEEDLNDNWNSLIKESDFIDIDNASQLIYYKSNTPIIISGLSTISDKEKISSKLDNIYKNIDGNYYSILLMHEPDLVKKIDLKYFNLILAGHSHGGQIRLPNVTFKTDGSDIYYKPYYNLDGVKLYISYGLGTSNYDLRLLNKPSFNLYRMYAK